MYFKYTLLFFKLKCVIFAFGLMSEAGFLQKVKFPVQFES